ncbi:MAG: quercetin 2,3-dioxygenase [Leptolyngbya sp.]|nr:MAG: quercetin 2,3-dioxygenase [Leptolyngbya sp.]
MPTLNQPSTVKTLHSIQRTRDRHWVGDGFPVRTLLAYNGLGQTISPFLLLDHAGPANFPPTTARRGVGEHPHRGFETVTIVYDGEVEHRDSAGGGGIIGPGDVQWMTAAAGLVHEEFHGPNFAKNGGPFEMVQLWVNLPAKDKMAEPRYQGITSGQIPVVELPEGQGSLRVIAGEFQRAQGPAQTFTPINMWDLRLTGGKQVNLELPEGYTTILVVLKGSVRVGGSEPIAEAEIGICDRAGTSLTLDGLQDTTALLLSGAPIDEPIVGHGPFVMNTTEEIYQAMADYQSGKMGALTPQ